jgi:two-component sensor histidine kinase
MSANLSNTRETSVPIAWLLGQHTTNSNPSQAARSDFAALAELSARLPRRAGGAIEILLGATRLFDDRFQALQPLWAQEATHRALSTLRLFARLQRSDCGYRSLRGGFERRLALHLSAELASLETTDITRVLPCSRPLRETARDLVALFGPAIGQVDINTHVTPLSLPAYRRRALVLLGNELVANSLTHAFDGRNIGHLSLRLDRVSATHARLLVCDDGVGFSQAHPNPAASVAGGLADLLQGEIRYLNPMGGGMAVKLMFPID